MSPTLVLVPTDFELQQLPSHFSATLRQRGDILEICGFGVIAAGIRTTQLLQLHRPKSVVLIGIAGSYSGILPIGTATTFSKIACYGVGAGSGKQFETAGELGWSQWQDSGSPHGFSDVIETSMCPQSSSQQRTLLTCCAASCCVEDVHDRLQKFPNAVAEDMESYAAAMACRCMNIPFTVVRGISNVAGDRDKSGWNVSGALAAAAELALTEITS
jgi:futalosine hydrolase